MYSKTYRYLEHCGPNNDDNLKYRTKKEIEYWLKKDPIKLEINKLKKNKSFDNEKYLKFCNSVRKKFISSIIKTKNTKSFSVKKLENLEYAK